MTDLIIFAVLMGLIVLGIAILCISVMPTQSDKPCCKNCCDYSEYGEDCGLCRTKIAIVRHDYICALYERNGAFKKRKKDEENNA